MSVGELSMPFVYYTVAWVRKRSLSLFFFLAPAVNRRVALDEVMRVEELFLPFT